MSPVAVAVFLLGQFVVLFGYYVIAELVTDGRSPGKKALGLRVVREDGLPIGAAQSLVRNLVRWIDFLPLAYGVGLVAVALSTRTQRLGDLAAGTLVVKDRGGRRMAALPVMPEVRAAPVAAPSGGPPLLSALERDTVDRFLTRRMELDDDARRGLARRLATPLRGRLQTPGLLDDESYLEALLAHSEAAR